MHSQVWNERRGDTLDDFRESKRQLLQMKSELEDRLNRTGRYGLDDPMRDELGELSLVDNHPADVASELFERQKDLGLVRLAEHRLDEVNGALKAIDDGFYGICQNCSKAIGQERMEANPLATLCIDCRERQEDLRYDLVRPVEESFLMPYWGRSNRDNSDVVEFDGEDSWQAVARYNQRAGYDRDYEVPLDREDMDDNEGIVDPIDRISNEQYRAQRP